MQSLEHNRSTLIKSPTLEANHEIVKSVNNLTSRMGKGVESDEWGEIERFKGFLDEEQKKKEREHEREKQRQVREELNN
jgi:hypothetical protein